MADIESLKKLGNDLMMILGAVIKTHAPKCDPTKCDACKAALLASTMWNREVKKLA